MPFSDYTRAGFASELLPILPADAAISPTSPSRADLEASRGKVPGRLTQHGWTGFSKWSEHQASDQDVAKWSRWSAGIGLQGRLFPGLDIDVDNREVADAVEKCALLDLGLAPARFGRGSRRLLVYSGAGLKKRRLAFRLPGRDAQPAAGESVRAARPDAERADDVLAEARPGGGTGAEAPRYSEHAVELLAEGQQYVIEGTHPRTKQPYAWRDGRTPATIGAAGLTPITAAEIDAFFDGLEWMIENVYGGEIISSAASMATANSAVVQETLAAPSLEAAARALWAIPNEDLAYDDWFQVMVAFKAATEALEQESDDPDAPDPASIFAEWSAGSGKDRAEITEAKWSSLRAPYRVGWSLLARLATEHSAGAFSAAAEEFEATAWEVQADGSAGQGLCSNDTLPDQVSNMWDRYAWVESAARMVHLESGATLNQEQFEFRVPPSEKGVSAWKLFKDTRPQRRQVYRHLTCRFGGPLIVTEDLPDLQGECLNIWRPFHQGRVHEGPVSDADIAPWLELAASVVPDPAERGHVMDFLAYTAQRQNDKIHHALVLGSTHEGVGKDTLLEPLRHVIGRAYVKEIGPEVLARPFNQYVVGTKLLVVQEMHNFERKATMNRMKPLIAAPPHSLEVNTKGRPEFFVPNLLNVVIFTNEPDALAVSRTDRRYFVSWNDDPPQDKAFYDRIWSWYRQGGMELVGAWLMQRDVSRFNAHGRAPITAALEEMGKAARPPLQEWIEDGVEEGSGLFCRDLVLVEEIADEAPADVRRQGQRPSSQKISLILKKIGARRISDKIWIPGFDGSRSIWALRRAEIYAQADLERLKTLFLEQRAGALARAVRDAGRRFTDD